MSDLPLVEIAYEAIRRKLLDAEYLPGKLLSESELAAELNMSRTPVRAAIARLEKEGFLETLKKRGILVKEINFKEMLDMFELMHVLYMYVLDVIEKGQYEFDLEAMKECLNNLIQASEEKRYRDYYESGLLMMRILLATIQNQCILDTFDAYKDKYLFYVVANRSTNRQNQPFRGRKKYAEIVECLSERNFSKAKKVIKESNNISRENLVRS